MSSNEILTLQFGHYSNFIGAHWWNMQELNFSYNPDHPSEINNDILFREGLTLKNEVTFTPRLLLVDLKGSLKSLPQEGELYNLPEEPTSDYEVVSKPPEEKINFQKDLSESATLKKIYDLDKDVRVWSDFLYSRFHPRTVNVIREYQHANEKNPFNIFPLGANLWKSGEFSEDFTDKIRNYIEECNNFQGFHVLLDGSDGFGGLATMCLEYLRDEYDTKSILSFPTNLNFENLNLLSTGLCFEALSEHSSLFTPLGCPDLQYVQHDNIPYHTSAIIAATLDTLTLNYRLKKSCHSLVDLCAEVGNHGRKGAAASVCFPFTLKQNEDLIDCLDSWQGALCHSVTPNCQIQSDNSLQILTLRGVPESRLKRVDVPKQREMPAYRCTNIKEMLEYYLVCTCFGTKSDVSVCGEQMAVKTPFPSFFDKKVGNTGDLGGERQGEVESVNVLAGLHNGKFVGEMFNFINEKLEKVRFKKFHQFISEGVEEDQFRETVNKLLDLKDCYEDNYLI